MVKPGVSKGGKLVIISDVNRMWPRAYMYRHKLHKNPTGWIAAGPLEVRRVMEGVSKMVIDEEDVVKRDTRKMFREKPHTT